MDLGKRCDFRSFRYVQYSAALIGTLPAASVSMNFVWTSPVMSKIKAGNTDIPADITETQLTWVVSSLLLGCFPGVLLSAWSIARYGRKTTLLLGAVPLLIPWFILAFANSAALLILGRFIAGVGVPVALVPVMLYTCEIADKDIRGRLALTMKILALSGELFVIIAGPHLSYKALTLCCAVVPIAFFIGLQFMPESPYYLVKAGKEELAEKSLTRLMSNTTEVSTIKRQMEEIRNTIENETTTQGTFWEFITRRNHRKSIMIGLGLLSLTQLSGAVALLAYMQTIFSLSASIIPPEISAVVVGMLELSGVITSAMIVDKVGRKPLLVISAIGCAVTLFAEGMYFWLFMSLKADVSSIFWLPTVGLGLNYCMRAIGVSTVPYIVIGEIFATNVQAHASTVCGFYSIITSFLVSVTFAPISSAFGVYVTFWIYTLMCILGALFVIFVLPETKGKTFAEIRQRLNVSDRSEDIQM